MKRPSRVLIAGGLLMYWLDAFASEELVTARSIGAAPAPAVVSFVARNAESWTIETALHKELTATSLRRIVETRCGSVNATYVDELRRANGLQQIDLDATVGTMGNRLVVPACLYASVGSGNV